MPENDELHRRKAQREAKRQQRLAQQRRLKLGLIAAAVVLLLCGILIFVLTWQNRQPGNSGSPTSTQPEQTGGPADTTAVLEDTTVIHIAAAGDLCVTDRTVAAGGENYDYTSVFMDVLPLLAEADVTLMNFEGNLCGSPYGTDTVSAPQQMVEALSAAGVDMLQMANSRSISNGLSGLKTTLNNIRAAGMEPLGAYSSAAEFKESGGYTIRDIQGIKVAFVAFTKGMDNLGLPAGSEDCVNLLYEDYTSNYQDVDKQGITKILRAAAAENPDLTVAMLHWGSEFNELISSTQSDILKLMRAEGVDVVLGTHPHLVQEMVLDKEKNTFVAYSLGDFFSDAERSGSNYSVVLDLEITKNNITGVTTITDFSYTPIFTQITESSMRILRIDDAIAAYESNNIDRVSQEDYDAMVYALTRIEKRINPED